MTANTSTTTTSCSTTRVVRFRITGNAAYTRIQPLLLQKQSDNYGTNIHWIDCSPWTTTRTTTTSGGADSTTGTDNTITTTDSIDFLWENAPRNETKLYRDTVQCYSHLPNGTNILDSKRVLARLVGGTTPVPTTNNPNKKNDTALAAVLPSYCFVGPDGFRTIMGQIGLLNSDTTTISTTTDPIDSNQVIFRDLDPEYDKYDAANINIGSDHTTIAITKQQNQQNWWVIKDSMSNGAGGIWMVNPQTCSEVQEQLIVGHSYVAQLYAYPPLLYQHRKFHVRVYGLVTSDGKTYLHNTCFLHVANDLYPTSSTNSTSKFPDSVHITNCCANSHDVTKFAGEIEANLSFDGFRTTNDNDTRRSIVGLAKFRQSMAASLALLLQRAFPFIEGGTVNGGFEYIGMDFILSYNSTTNQPIAYLLEVNAPPSQDTATGLPHAENVHNTVINDVLTLWVYPKLFPDSVQPVRGGWNLVHDHYTNESTRSETQKDGNTHIASSTLMNIPYSKAVLINKIRWTIYEKKLQQLSIAPNRDDDDDDTGNNKTKNGSVFPSSLVSSHVSKVPDHRYNNNPDADHATNFAHYCRRLYPYFQTEHYETSGSNNRTTQQQYTQLEQDSGCPSTEGTQQEERPSRIIFMENAGGTQVPQSVIDTMCLSLQCRHRSIIGARSKERATEALHTLLGAAPNQYTISFNSNASTLLSILAQHYVQNGLIKRNDEIILSIENHTANTQPWIDAAASVGAKIIWWYPPLNKLSANHTLNHSLEALVSKKTRIVAIPHISNILGYINDIVTVRDIVRPASNGYAHIVVDGVSAVPHIFANVDALDIDWYVLSMHKIFGPHLGALCGKSVHYNQLNNSNSIKSNPLEVGTVNYEACEGVVGLGLYFQNLAKCTNQSDDSTGCVDGVLSRTRIKNVYRMIHKTESSLVNVMLKGLHRSSKVRIIGECSNSLNNSLMVNTDGTDPLITQRIPIVSFVHEEISSDYIVEHCAKYGIICRNGTFLSTQQFQRIYDVDTKCGLVRLSLVHYNTISEVQQSLQILELLPNWF